MFDNRCSIFLRDCAFDAVHDVSQFLLEASEIPDRIGLHVLFQHSDESRCDRVNDLLVHGPDTVPLQTGDSL